MSPQRRSMLGILAAFAAVYLIWGSTYLGIRFALESMPPLLMTGARWILAGAPLFAWRLAATGERPTWAHLRTGAIVGTLLIFGGNGLVAIAQQWIPSSVAALVVAFVPAWIVLLEWIGPSRIRPTPRTLAGVVLGLVGVTLLVGPAAVSGASGAGWLGAVGMLVVLAATLSWANGSLYSRKAPRPADHLLGASLQMLAGGIVLTLVGLARGEASAVDVAAVSARSWWAWGFLVAFGSIVAYSAYVWLLQVVRAELVATYAFVNPIVAVFLGVTLAGEAFGTRTAIVAALIVVAVAIIVTAPRPAIPAPPPVPAPSR